MAKSSSGVSFYFFDFDDNIMFLSTTIFILNTLTKKELAVSTSDFAQIHPVLGRPGEWEDYALFEGSFRNFRDVPKNRLKRGQNQTFVRDIEQTITAGSDSWKAPSWDLFVYACAKQRPVSLVTARGHSPETIQEGIRVLVQHNLIPCEPNYHTIFPVGNDTVRRKHLGDTKLIMTTPALKKIAIIASVEKALENFGAVPEHRFGMSDDDPHNVNLIISAMRDCKIRFPDKRFFVINTHFEQKVKLEVFAVDFPVAGKPGTETEEPLRE